MVIFKLCSLHLKISWWLWLRLFFVTSYWDLDDETCHVLTEWTWLVVEVISKPVLASASSSPQFDDLCTGKLKRNSSTNSKDESKSGDPDRIAAQTFTFRELATATRNFRADCLLGEGGFGRVYQGRLESNNQVSLFSCDIFCFLMTSLFIKNKMKLQCNEVFSANCHSFLFSILLFSDCWSY